jgi:aminoglycoside phosphotransferase (APT) family kinase protein
MLHTHGVVIGPDRVTKTYSSWDRAEHRREWAALRHLHRHAPDLAPGPISANLDAAPPTLVMTRVPGIALSGHPSPDQVRALIVAVRTLWAVPATTEAVVEPWYADLPYARRFTDSARPADPLVAAAYDAAHAWWHGPDPGLLATAPPDLVLGHRDPNLNNYLWDGTRVRIVDFEDAALSDPSTELALLVEHVSTRALDSESLCDAFPVDPTRLRAARRAFAMFWMWLLRPGGPAARRNPPDTDRAQARRLLDLLNTH